MGLLAGQWLVLLTALVANVFMARTIGASGRGQVALILQGSYLATAVVLLGRDRAYPVISEETDFRRALSDQIRLLKAPLVLLLVMSVPIVAISLAEPRQRLVAAISWAGLVVGGAAFRMCRSAGIAVQAPRQVVGVVVASQAVLLLGIVSLWALHVESASVWMLTYALAGLVPLVSWISTFRVRTPGVDVHAVRRLGFRLLPASLAETSVMRLDRILIPVFASFTSLGLYIVVATMTELAAWPAQQYSDSKVPLWAREGVSRSRLVQEIGVVVAMTSAAVVVCAVAVWFGLVPVFGPDFTSARRLILPLSAAAVCAAVYRLVYNVASSAHASRSLVMLAIVAGLNAAVVYPIAIWQFGAMGAAWASAFALASSSLAGMCVLPRAADLRDVTSGPGIEQ